MKKLFLLSVLLLTVLCIISCSAPADNGDSVDTADKTEDVNPDSIQVETVLGLNEQIYLTLAKGEYVISYKSSDSEEYTLLDKELMLENDKNLECYILGLAKGLYDVKIEQGEGDGYACKVFPDIDVEKQDRSGYAHFGREDGIGGYNNDGTVKDNAKIIYVTNENKNTVTLDINGTSYTGLVEILNAKQYMDEPLIVRVLDRITTNQWKTTKEAPRTKDTAAINDDYFRSLFSDKFGENLAGLTINAYVAAQNKHYEYVTTPDGIELVAVLDEETSSNNTDANLLVAENAKDVTIEGVGSKAEIYQFGIGFMYSDSIEIRNLSFRHYPEDGLQLLAYGSAGACNLHGYYWVHNNTFKEGLDNWGVGDADGDESVSLADVRNVTFSFNKFYKTGKTLILGGWEYDACMNMTFHHNYYFLCGQRLPLSRNSNIHNYNNYFAECQRGLSPRVSTYVFSEANYFDGVGEAYYGDSGSEPFGAIKSFGDIYRNTGADDMVVKVTERDAYVENTCMPDEKTDYTRFDTDPELFYYDAVNKRSDVDLIHEAKELPDFVPKYAGAGILARLEFPTVEG